MKIAICITTFNRPEVLERSLIEHWKYLPLGAKLFVVDDGSTDKLDISVFPSIEYIELPENVGIARAKNKCLELAHDWGADHIFLFDDDTYPIDRSWWVPYVVSKERHLMYQFRLPGRSSRDMRELERTNRTVSYSHTRGCMLYIKRRVLDVVGGLDTAYGLGMYEHTDWTNRIHNAGLTTHRAMDVVGSDKLLYCLDQDNAIESSLPLEIRRNNIRENRKLYRDSKTSKEYKEFRS